MSARRLQQRPVVSDATPCKERPRFRARFFRDPERASLEIGLDLSAQELDALVRIPTPVLARLEACLDARLCRLRVPDEPESAEGVR